MHAREGKKTERSPSTQLHYHMTVDRQETISQGRSKAVENAYVGETKPALVF
jgi:hypothetical protein